MSRDMAAMLVPRLEQAAQSSNIGWHTGVIQSWDELTGLNTVDVAGTVFNNVLVLSTGAPQAYTPGDVVIVLRLNTQYFVVGKVRQPGYGAGERIASDRVAEHVTNVGAAGVGSSYGHISGSYGPEVTVYIGSARRALVIHSCEINVWGIPEVDTRGRLDQAVAISGASDRPPASAVTNAYHRGIAETDGSVSASTLVTADDGLQQGQNTFTCLYRIDEESLNGGLSVNNRVLTVIPF